MPRPVPDREPTSARDYPLDEVAAHVSEERRSVSLLAEVRETVFGAQDGLVSTLAVVATVAGATGDNRAVLIAGLASAIAGVFSMAIGEYVGSKSQAEIFQAQIDDERREVEHRPFEAEAEVAYLFLTEGMDEEDAWQTARTIARYPDSLLHTMVAKELGIVADEAAGGSPLHGAIVMGASFAAGAVAPILPFLFTSGAPALTLATLLTALVLFTLGAFKTRWTRRSWWRSGLEIVVLAAVAGGAGYLFGTVLPSLLGAPTA